MIPRVMSSDVRTLLFVYIMSMSEPCPGTGNKCLLFRYASRILRFSRFRMTAFLKFRLGTEIIILLKSFPLFFT